MIVNLLRERRVLISSAGPHGNVLKIRPPLVFGTEHADLLVETLDQALTELNLVSGSKRTRVLSAGGRQAGSGDGHDLGQPASDPGGRAAQQ